MSILITLSATLGMMIDNVIAGNLLGSGAVAAIGMSLSVFMLFSGCAGILETGAVALCARALGNRDADRVNVLFSVSLAAALAVGAALSVGGVAGADALATMLGAASGELHADTAAYLSGICSGAFAIVLLQLLMGFTRLDNAPQLGIVAIVGMGVCDVVFNLVAVCVLDLGLRGMGLATALAYCVAVGICCTHFPSKHNTLHLVNPVPHAGQLAGVLKTGLPDSLTRATVMVRTFTFNWLLLTVASAGAVAALSMLSSVNSFASSVTIGVGQTATLLCGIFFGEEDRGALKATLRTGMRMGLMLSCALCAAVFAFAPQVVGLFGLEGDAEALQLVVAGVLWRRRVAKGAAAGAAEVAANESAAPAIAGDRDGIAAGGAVVDKATLLDKMMYLPETFQADWRAFASFACAPMSEAVVACSQQVAAWCESHGVDGRRSYLVPLAVEEMAANAVEHGFAKTKHPAIDVKLILKRDGTLVLRMRDNGAAFNPMDLDLSAADPCSAVGIRMLRQGVREVEYQNTVGLNNVVVTLPAASQ